MPHLLAFLSTTALAISLSCTSQSESSRSLQSDTKQRFIQKDTAGITFSPPYGVFGQPITVTGSGFNANSKVSLGAIQADTTYVSGTQLQAIIPDLARPARIIVETDGALASSVDTFWVAEFKGKPEVSIYGSITGGNADASASKDVTVGGFGSGKPLLTHAPLQIVDRPDNLKLLTTRVAKFTAAEDVKLTEAYDHAVALLNNNGFGPEWTISKSKIDEDYFLGHTWGPEGWKPTSPGSFAFIIRKNGKTYDSYSAFNNNTTLKTLYYIVVQSQ